MSVRNLRRSGLSFFQNESNQNVRLHCGRTNMSKLRNEVGVILLLSFLNFVPIKEGDTFKRFYTVFNTVEMIHLEVFAQNVG